MRSSLAALSAVGGSNIRSYPQFERVTLRLPLASVLGIAQRSDVQSIAPTAKPILNRDRWRRRAERFRADQGGHCVALRARHQHGVGELVGRARARRGSRAEHRHRRRGRQGLRAVRQRDPRPLSAACRRPAIFLRRSTCWRIPSRWTCEDEGAAMMEIVYDMAPGAALGFATAFMSDVDFADNIVKLQQSPHNCNIIVDDVTYDNEGAFQDGIIAQAVKHRDLRRRALLLVRGEFEQPRAQHVRDLGRRFRRRRHQRAADRRHGAQLRSQCLRRADARAASRSPCNGPTRSERRATTTTCSSSTPTGTTVVGSGNSAQTGTQDPFEFIDCSVPAAVPGGWASRDLQENRRSRTRAAHRHDARAAFRQNQRQHLWP